MKNVLIVVFILFTFNINGQRGNSSSFDTRIGSIASSDGVMAKFYRLHQNDKESISGSRYVFSDFKQKGIFYINNKAYTVYGANIDVISNDIVSLVGTDSILVYNKNKIDSLHINQKKYLKNSNHIFYEVLFKGNKLSFLKKHKGIITEGYKNVMKGTEEKEGYKITTEYYIKKDGVYTPVKLKKKEVLNILTTHKNEIVKFAKENKLSYKKESDLIKIFRYNDTL